MHGFALIHATTKDHCVLSKCTARSKMVLRIKKNNDKSQIIDFFDLFLR